MRVSDFDRIFRDGVPGYPKGATCNGLKAGSMDQQVSKVATTWMATVAVIEEAARLGVDLIVTHEPTLYSHYTDPGEKASIAKALGAKALGAKAPLLDETGIAVYRVHDGWDPYPVCGNHDAWVDQLGLFKRDSGRLYRCERTPFRRLAEKIKERMGLAALRCGGPIDKEVETAILGQGASLAGPVIAAIESGADCLILGENVEWQAVRMAGDHGIPVAITGHSMSEGEGMRRMTEFLGERAPECEYCYIPTGDSFAYL